MSRVKLTNPNIVKDGMYYLHPESGTNTALAKGMLVGLVTCLMAQGKTFKQAVEMLKPYLPSQINNQAFPDKWLDEFVK